MELEMAENKNSKLSSVHTYIALQLLARERQYYNSVVQNQVECDLLQESHPFDQIFNFQKLQ